MADLRGRADAQTHVAARGQWRPESRSHTRSHTHPHACMSLRSWTRPIGNEEEKRKQNGPVCRRKTQTKRKGKQRKPTAGACVLLVAHPPFDRSLSVSAQQSRAEQRATRGDVGCGWHANRLRQCMRRKTAADARPLLSAVGSPRLASPHRPSSPQSPPLHLSLSTPLHHGQCSRDACASSKWRQGQEA